IHTTADQSAKHHCSPAPCKQMKRKSDNCHNTNLSIHVRERICIRLAEKNIIAVGKGKKRNHDPIERTPYWLIRFSFIMSEDFDGKVRCDEQRHQEETVNSQETGKTDQQAGNPCKPSLAVLESVQQQQQSTPEKQL